MAGQDLITITEEELDVGKISGLVTEPTTGATSLFVGTTRDNFKGKKVIRLEYEAYFPMAKKKLKELCNRMRVKWPDVLHIAVYHRLGHVGPTEASVVIAVSSPHRASSLEAVHFAIDELKATVPIWKKEQYADGSEWKENKECFFTADNPDPGPAQAGLADPSLVQIHATKEELDQRMDAFIAAKRVENNKANILEFCGRTVNDDDINAQLEHDDYDHDSSNSTCARTDSVLIRKRGSKSHLRKSVVDNLTGPGRASASGDPVLAGNSNGENGISGPALNERLENVEAAVLSSESMSNRPVPKDVYSRLKALEDRVLLMERLNPSLFQQSELTNNQSANTSDQIKTEPSNGNSTREYKEQLTESLVDINAEIDQLRNALYSNKK